MRFGFCHIRSTGRLAGSPLAPGEFRPPSPTELARSAPSESRCRGYADLWSPTAIECASRDLRRGTNLLPFDAGSGEIESRSGRCDGLVARCGQKRMAATAPSVRI